MSLVVKNVQGLELVGGFILIPNILILMTHVVSAISDSVGLSYLTSMFIKFEET
jgi:hypothetical protein